LFFELSGCKLVSAIFLVLTTLYSPAQAQVLPQAIPVSPPHNNTPIGPLKAQPHPAGCPAPPNNINFAIVPTITFDPTSNLYTYSYAVTNLPTSQNAIAHFALDFTPPIQNIASPTGWAPMMFNGRNTVYWAAGGGTFGSGQDTGGIPPSPYQIAPGSALPGFSFKSPNPPAGAPDYVLGCAPLPTAVDANEGDESAAEDLAAQCRSVTGNFFDMARVGFTSVPAGAITPVQIDIVPFQSPNFIDPASSNPIPVAVMSNPMYASLLMDPTTATFGPGHAPVVNSQFQDVNDDGIPDLILYFAPSVAAIPCGGTSATLDIYTSYGVNGRTHLQGTDWVTTVNCTN
jgi:hypothetical protein